MDFKSEDNEIEDNYPAVVAMADQWMAACALASKKEPSTISDRGSERLGARLMNPISE